MTLAQFFSEHKNVGIALSGGVDSIYLMYSAVSCGADVRAYFAKTEFQPESELCDAAEAAERLSVPLRVIEFSVLEDENIVKNGEDRCYFCKRGMMDRIAAAANEDGCEIICDGTNASDDVSERPGFRALGEFSVVSPLRICGMTKEEIRNSARDAGIRVWDKPSYSCLATRIKQGEKITQEKIARVNEAEKELFSLGFSNFRVRLGTDEAKLELSKKDTQLYRQNQKETEKVLKKHFNCVIVELEARE
ncbi:MAG: ATP-dependent sacrificial sulfur transferase LarE [Ruminococcaceae bacterium]|nr:ATP-dependent sacrificial sulfur transferase LarE [Oscillospiraceae bacterium]